MGLVLVAEQATPYRLISGGPQGRSKLKGKSKQNAASKPQRDSS